MKIERILFTAFFAITSINSVLADDYAYGMDGLTKQDLKTVLRPFKRDAALGDPIAQVNLGVMYEQGKGVPQDYAKALKLYRLAAQKGYDSAQYCLGAMYNKGRGVPQNYAEAVKWYRLSAQQGYGLAQVNLGVMYERGNGVPQDSVEALKWFNVAVALGYGSDNAIENRDRVVKEMSPAQISKAQKLAQDCMDNILNHLKGCN